VESLVERPDRIGGIDDRLQRPASSGTVADSV
jgi:hypothetical protein